MKESKRQTESGRARKLEPSVNMDELRELIALLRENGLSEFELEREGFRVRLRRGSEYEANPLTSQPAMAAPSSQGRAEAPAPVTNSPLPLHPASMAGGPASEDQDLHIIESPIVGTFYRSRSPNADPFVKPGTTVEPTSVVCIIEAMKLMNEIQAETSGEVVKIYVENGQPVEYGQPLFGIRK